VSMAVIVFHLWHGASSALQSFGVNSATWSPRLQWLGRGLAVAIGLGFAILPVYTFVIGARQ
jgi:succinate dehydrogenase / fumarate reductase, cytochrome b subunit